MSSDSPSPIGTTVVGRVVSLRAFPVKSLDALPLASARFLTSGVQDDRRWAVVDEAGELRCGECHESDAIRSRSAE